MRWLGGILLILHGLVHLWYVTLSQGWVGFQPDMGWTGRSWLLSGFFPSSLTRAMASALFALAAVAFITSGAGVFSRAEWVNPLLVASTILSSVVILLFWDGGMEKLVQKGLLGFVINLAVLGIIFLIK
jgi:hypothetical protein